MVVDRVGVGRVAAVLVAAAWVILSCASDAEADRARRDRPADDRSVDDPSVDDRHADPWMAASYRGNSPAPPLPTSVDWINVSRPGSLESLRGKVVVIDFWTYGCINCVHNMPVIKELLERYPEELVVIGVHSAKFPNEADPDALRATVRRYGIDYPVLNDADRSIMDQWGARAWPTLFLIDPEGNVAGKETGEGFERKFDRAIASLIREFDEEGAIDRTPVSWISPDRREERSLLSFPQGILATEDHLYVSDTGHHRILEVDRANGSVIRVFGTGRPEFVDGLDAEAAFHSPRGMALDGAARTLYVADSGNHAVRAINLADGSVETVAGVGARGRHYPPAPGTLPAVFLRTPWDVELYGGALIVSVAGSHQLWRLDREAGTATYLAGTGAEGVRNGSAATATLAQPSGLDGGPALYFADAESSSIRAFGPAEGGIVRTVAGPTDGLFTFGRRDGAAEDALFQHPTDVAVVNGAVYVTDTYNNAIRRIAGGAVTTVAGGEAGWVDGTAPRFDAPSAIDVYGGTAYIADTNNHAVRRLDLERRVATTMLIVTSEPDAVAVPRTEHTVDAMVRRGANATVRVAVTFPAGYELQSAAPSRVSIRTIAEDGRTTESRSVAVERFPTDVTARIPRWGDRVLIDLWIAYCESDAKERCYFEQVRYALTAGDTDSGSVAAIDHRIDAPEGAAGHAEAGPLDLRSEPKDSM